MFLTKRALGRWRAELLVEVSSSMRRYLGSFLLGAVLATPVVVRADDEHERRERQEANRVQRYYDPQAKDWHEWNEQEERAYHRWWDEHHHDRAFRDWNRLNDRERREYWRWRHEHHDRD
jgi:hypothetical protein